MRGICSVMCRCTKGCQTIQSCGSSDRVIYYGYNSYGIYGPIHSAIVTNTYGGCPTELTSKWGQDGIYHHGSGCTPYGTDIVYYHKSY